jgi:hypothetical protein
MLSSCALISEQNNKDFLRKVSKRTTPTNFLYSRWMPSTKSVLEVCCDEGRFTEVLLSVGARVFACESRRQWKKIEEHSTLRMMTSFL